MDDLYDRKVSPLMWFHVNEKGVVVNQNNQTKPQLSALQTGTTSVDDCVLQDKIWTQNLLILSVVLKRVFLIDWLI